MPFPATSPQERRELLRAARAAIAAHLRGEPPVSLPQAGVFARCAGLFVSLHHGEDLRGCIGHPSSDQAVSNILASCAISAATEDPRFESVAVGELDELQIELSLLGPIERVADVAEIEVGRHGLIIEQGGWRGLLLPQVATEHDWDRETFLAHTCVKAGLRPDAWKSGAQIYRFEAEVFGDVTEGVSAGSQ